MKKSFTLIEMIIIVTIIGILAVLSALSTNGVMSNTKMTQTKSELKIVRDAVKTYINFTGYVPINGSGLGLTKENFDKNIDYKYVVLNLDLLSHKQMLDDGGILNPQMYSIPNSSKLKKTNIVNEHKQNPSFIYVIDKDYNVYLADATKDSTYGFYNDTKIYESQNADTLDKKYNLKYKAKQAILEELEPPTPIDMTDATIVTGDIIIPKDLTISNTTGNPNVGNTGYTSDGSPISNGDTPQPQVTSKVFYKNLSSIGYTLFAELYNINFSLIDSVDMEVKAGGITKTIQLQAVNSSRWIARVSAIDFGNASGYYVNNIVIHYTNNKTYPISSFSVVIDNAAPSVKITKSKDSFYSEKPITVTLTASDAEPSSGIKKMEYRINNGNWTTYKDPFSLSIPDYYLIEARAVDNFNNVSKTSSSIVNNYLIPEIYLTQGTDKIIVDIGVDVADEDTLWNVSFEKGTKLPVFNYNISPLYGVLGGHSFSTDDAFDGSYSLKLDTTYPGNGNNWDFPNTKSDYSRVTYGRLYNKFTNGQHLSLVYRYKATDYSVVQPIFDGGWGETILDWGKIIMQDVPVGTKTIKLNSVSGLYLRAHVTSDTDPSIIQSVPYVQQIDPLTNTITLNAPLAKPLYAGNTLKYRPWRGVGSFAYNYITSASDEWKLSTANTTVANNLDYDAYKRGINFIMINMTKGQLYIDNVKMGYASTLALYKNGVRMNTTAQEYTTHYEDTNTKDINKPLINNLQINKDDNNFDITVDGEDIGTTYTYSVTRTSTKGKEYSSKPKSLTITSGLDRCYYVIDNNPDTASVPKTNYTTEGIINKTLDKSKSWYIHIIAIDKAGNVSDIKHAQLN